MAAWEGGEGKSIEIDRGLGVLRDEEEGVRPVAGVGFPLGIIETLWNATRFLCQWNFPGKDIGVGCHFLLQGVFLTQG